MRERPEPKTAERDFSRLRLLWLDVVRREWVDTSLDQGALPALR
ncbi:hypothetical protein SAMN04487904_102280 [Actinopolyspora lacussalsi subsp. righensis]|uniref:Uncharacterized protein n=1 Tax=Actinopolyspora righensis TaxID=995060 RepID=A0A1I6Y7K2_9ACTN|nr:hypothetical protein SAMN04487904_102280 [Actinopolyspora righensis]